MTRNILILTQTHLLEANKQEIIENHSYLFAEGLKGQYPMQGCLFYGTISYATAIKCSTHLYYSLSAENLHIVRNVFC